MQRADSDGLRTLLVGVDAGCVPVLDDLADATPTIGSLRADGTAAPLESQVPPWTPSAWPSMYTGVNPGKHGVYGFLSFEGYDWDVVNRTDVRERAVWETLSEHGVTSVVVNVPVTHPPATFDGALVPGYTAPESPDCHPPGLLSELRSELGEYRVYADGLDEVSEAERIEGYEGLIEQRGAAFRYLVDRFDPGFGFVQFQSTDTVFHELPDRDDAVERVYRAVDRELSEILEVTDPDVVLLASDHGMAPFDGHEVRLNAVLRDRGYVETVADGEGMPSWAAIGRKRLRSGEESSPGAGDATQRSLAERAVGTLGAAGLTAQRVGAVLEWLHLDRLVLEHVPADVVRAASERVDFAASTAYARDRIELGIRINLDGREPEGVVAPAEYEAVRSALIETLESLETPEGEPVFDAVLPREAVFDGPHVEEAPDVVVEPAGYEHYLSTTIRDAHFGEPGDDWTHDPEGVVIAAGDAVDADASLDGAHLFDVAPTILATFGVPAAERMDGDVLPVVQDAGREAHPPFAPTWSPGRGMDGGEVNSRSGGDGGSDTAPGEGDEARAGEDVTDRLRAMGYVE